MKTETITIVGLDRIGASVGLALKQRNLDGVTIVGHDPNQAQMRAAQDVGAVDSVQNRLINAAAAADILIIALPAHQLEATFAIVGDRLRPHTLVIAFSPLKQQGTAWAEQYFQNGHFVAAAPVFAADALADARRGVDAARADLFHDSLICYMPSPHADPKAVETAVTIGGLLGAKPFFLDAAEYDSLMQGLDTLPGLMATALFRTITKSPGWRDMLRFAGLPFALATAALQNEEEVVTLALQDTPATLRWIEGLLAELETLRALIYAQEEEQLTAYIQQLQADRARWLRQRAANDWDESATSDVKPMSMRERMLGSHLGGSDL